MWNLQIRGKYNGNPGYAIAGLRGIRSEYRSL